MKPVKNRIFCLDSQRTKMLFESKSKDLNFIKFNSDEIMHENGVAPKRVYFCNSCGGWHVTSNIRPTSERGQVRVLIGKAYRLLGEKYWASAQRFLCYADEKLRMINERLQPCTLDFHLASEIRKAKKILDNSVARHQKDVSYLGASPMFKYMDLNFNHSEIEVETIFDSPENDGVVYVVRPNLLVQHGNKYYYMLCTCRLNEKEVQLTKIMNAIDEQDDIVQTLVCHNLNMVEMKHSFDNDNKNQYEDVSDAFKGDILATWKYGMRLMVVERIRKYCNFNYRNRSGYDYWIKLGRRNVHFYLGHPSKYTCLVSQTPLDPNYTFQVFKSKAK